MWNEILSFRQSRNKLNMFNLFDFQLCRKDEISRKYSLDFVAKNGNNVKATYNFVERTIFYNKLFRHCCHFWQQSQMLLRQSRTLLRNCCWCGQGLKNQDQQQAVNRNYGHFAYGTLRLLDSSPTVWSFLQIEQTERCCSETESVTAQICSSRNRTEPHKG